MDKQIIDTLIKFGLITNIGVDANAYKDVDDLINKGVVTIPGAKSKINELLKNIKIEVVDEPAQEVKVTETVQEVKVIEPVQEVKVTEPVQEVKVTESEQEVKVTEPDKEIEVIVEEATDVTVSTTKNAKKQNKTK